jgi:hypothetical protein
MKEFYALPKRHVGLVKKDRKSISEAYKRNRNSDIAEMHKVEFPAIQAEIEKSLKTGKLEQGAIISECVYAQTLAKHLNLSEFANYELNPNWLSDEIVALLSSYSLKPRYLYMNSIGSRILIQAGGPAGIDSALISVADKNIFTIEFKESLAKSSEADLPRYGEDGYLISDSKFAKKWPQFLSMIEEQLLKELNFFEHIGSNINDFSPESIKDAVNENYAGKKFADVICTEDNNGFLTMIPANQADVWGPLSGEIRPSGRNPYDVWTPNRLRLEILAKGGIINGEVVRMPIESLKATPPRGGTGISRYKVNSLFFIRAEHVSFVGNIVEFAWKDVKQNRPTIAAKMDFKGLNFDDVKNYYIGTSE